MEPGKYEVFFAPDVSCGASAFSDTGVLFEVIEPAHIQRMEPAEGLEQAETTITLVGSNIGGPRVYCDLHWLKADGAKWGCEMTVDSAPAVNWTSTSAVCVVPKWPGPLTQYDGKGGFHPLEGAECGRKVRVQLTNDAKVESEPIIFRYAEVPKSAIVV
jgi:hypothetical protein